MFGSFGWMELLLILIIVLIIFGAGKIPQLGEGLGKAIKGFKKSVHEADALDVTPDEDRQEQAGSQQQQVPSQVAQAGQSQPGAARPGGTQQQEAQQPHQPQPEQPRQT